MPLLVPLSMMKLCVSRGTEDPRELVEAMDPKETRWVWDRLIKFYFVGGRGDKRSMNEDIVWR